MDNLDNLPAVRFKPILMRNHVTIPESHAYMRIRIIPLQYMFRDDTHTKRYNKVLTQLQEKVRVNKIVHIIRVKKAQDIQRWWRELYLRPTTLPGYDYPVSRYMRRYQQELQ